MTGNKIPTLRQNVNECLTLTILLSSMNQYYLSHLKELESEAIYVIREVVAQFERPALLFSGGKDSGKYL